MTNPALSVKTFSQTFDHVIFLESFTFILPFETFFNNVFTSEILYSKTFCYFGEARLTDTRDTVIIDKKFPLLYVDVLWMGMLNEVLESYAVHMQFTRSWFISGILLQFLQ